jgi:predicted RNase H-like HicB family nuclease
MAGEVIMLEYHAAYYEIEDGWYMGVVLDFPGVVTQGKTLNAARRMLRLAIEDMADWYMEDGQTFPRPNPRARDKKAVVLEPIRLTAKAKTGVAT